MVLAPARTPNLTFCAWTFRTHYEHLHEPPES